MISGYVISPSDLKIVPGKKGKAKSVRGASTGELDEGVILALVHGIAVDAYQTM
jgi:hypothetical protein